MRQPPTYKTWTITCRSPDDARALQQWLAPRIDPDRVWTDLVRTGQNCTEQAKEVPHRLGDYFAEIRTLPESGDRSASFRLVFRRRPEAGRFWKDLMVNVLEKVRTDDRTASLELDSKSETTPPSSLTGPGPKVTG